MGPILLPQPPWQAGPCGLAPVCQRHCSINCCLPKRPTPHPLPFLPASSIFSWLRDASRVGLGDASAMQRAARHLPPPPANLFTARSLPISPCSAPRACPPFLLLGKTTYKPRTGRGGEGLCRIPAACFLPSTLPRCHSRAPVWWGTPYPPTARAEGGRVALPLSRGFLCTRRVPFAPRRAASGRCCGWWNGSSRLPSTVTVFFSSHAVTFLRTDVPGGRGRLSLQQAFAASPSLPSLSPPVAPLMAVLNWEVGIL